MTIFYDIGTVTTVQNSKIVTGDLTGWAAALIVGGRLIIANKVYSIESIDSDTQLTLRNPFPDAGGSGLAYEIDRVSDAELQLSKNSQSLAELLDALRDEELHSANQGNPHNVTKAQVGLGSVNDTADADKPVSTPQQAALDALQTIIDGKQAALGFTPVDKAGDTMTGNLNVPALLTSPANRWDLDASSNALVLANGASFAFTGGSGPIFLTNGLNGSTALFVVGGGGTVLLAQSSGASWVVTTSPAAGQVGFAFNGSGYQITNNFGSAVTFYSVALKSRPSV